MKNVQKIVLSKLSKYRIERPVLLWDINGNRISLDEVLENLDECYKKCFAVLKDQRLHQIGLRIAGITEKTEGESKEIEDIANKYINVDFVGPQYATWPPADSVLMETNIPGYEVKRGKVRDVYEIENNMLVIITTDRISAFDRVFPTGIPDKGKILTKLSNYWFDTLNFDNHLVSDDIEDMPQPFLEQKDVLEGRISLVRKTDPLPYEFIVRGFLTGSAWKEYVNNDNIVAGKRLAPRLIYNQHLPEPLFTPFTKEKDGHDKPISWSDFVKAFGEKTAVKLRDNCITIYKEISSKAFFRGIIVADTKMEFGRLKNGSIILIDELLTPDCSRFWPTGRQDFAGFNDMSLDKQFVRDWASKNWSEGLDLPIIPRHIVNQVRERYLEALTKLTGEGL